MSWKSLDQVYLQESAFRKVSKLPRQQVIGENKINIYKELDGEYDLLGSVDNKGLKKISRVFKDSEEVKNYIQSKNYTLETIKDFTYNSLLNLLINSDFDNYIKEKKPKLKDNTVGSIVNILGGKLDKDFLIQLARLTGVDSGGSNIGPGEIAISLIFDDVKNSDSGGDLQYDNGDKIEVKGQMGRFGQQAGRSAQRVSDFVLNKELDIPVEIDEYPRINEFISAVYKRYKEENVLDKFNNNLYAFLEDIYPNGEPEKFFNNVNFDNINDIRLKLQKVYTNNYLNTYDYDNILFIDKNSLKYMIFSKEDALKEGGLIDTRRLRTEMFNIKDLYPQNKIPELRK